MKRLVRVQDAERHTLQMDYDPSGNLVQLMDAKGFLTRWQYDKSDRTTTAWATAPTPSK